MSKKLFVGCPVRIVSTSMKHNSYLIGSEARVAGFDRLGVRLDIHPLPDGTNWIFSHHLEPIEPSGHRSGDYSYTELMDRCKAGEVECV